MPAGYVRMRDSFKKKGLSDKAAKKKAAMIWNSKHKGNPVTRAKHEAFCNFIEGHAKQPDPEHNNMFDALANRSATLIKKDNTVGNATGAALSAISKEHADYVIARETAKHKKHEEFCNFMKNFKG